MSGVQQSVPYLCTYHAQETQASWKWDKMWTGQIIHIPSFLGLPGKGSFSAPWTDAAKQQSMLLSFCDVSSFYTCDALHVCRDMLSVLINLYLYFFAHIILILDHFYLQTLCPHGSLAAWQKSSIVCEKCFCGENPSCMGGEEGGRTMSYISSFVALAIHWSLLSDFVTLDTSWQCPECVFFINLELLET